VPDRLVLARSSLAAGNFRAAQAYAAEVLAADPNQREALDIRETATSALQRLDAALVRTRSIMATGDLQGAARALAEARDIDPTSPAVSELAATLAARVRDRGTDAQPRGGRERTSAAPAAPMPTAGAAASAPPVERAAVLPAPQATPEQPAAPVPPPAAPPAVAPAPAVDATADANAAGRTAPRNPPAAPPAPAPTPTPDRAPTPSAPARAADDEAAVRRVVASYARAIESKDLAMFRSVKPNLSREEERRLVDGFRAVTSQQVNITPTSVDVREHDASVVAERRDVIDAGGRRQTVQSRQTFQLTRTPTGWVIVDIR
jgi:hypothetical protein